MKRIIYTQDNGTVAIMVPTSTIEASMKDIPEGVDYEIVDVSEIPTDRTFRNAWVKDAKEVKTDIPKAKVIAHDKRRIMRSEEFAPLDIQATIPSEAVAAEAARVVIRDKYDTMQTDIDDASNEAELKTLLGL